MQRTEMAEVTAALVKTLRDMTGAGIVACRNALTETGGDLDAAVERLRAADTSKAVSKAERTAKEGLVGVLVEGNGGAVLQLDAETDFVTRSEPFRGAAAALTRTAKDVRGDRAALLAAPAPDGIGTVADLIARLIARTGEQIVVRRCAFLSTARGTLASYVHNAVAPGLGTIGVLVAIESSGDPVVVADLGHRVAMQIAASAPLWPSTQDVPADVIAAKRAELAAQAGKSGKPEHIVAAMVEGRLRKYVQQVVLAMQPYVLDLDRTVKDALDEAARNAGAPIAVRQFVRYRTGQEGAELS
jgi:elongation factor Ts